MSSASSLKIKFRILTPKFDSLDIVEEMKTCYTDPNYANPWYKNDDNNARIIVDSKMKKTIQNGVFFLPDLSTALKIAKNGDKIIIKSGSYVINEEEENNYEITKNIQIIGTGPGNTTIKVTTASSFIVKATNDGIIRFENLKLEITKGALYLYGQAMFQCCFIESCINTVIYVMPSSEKSEISIKYSILDGLTKVSRFLCLSPGSQLNMEGCIVKDMFSFCSVIGKKHACKKYDQFVISTSCFWGSTGSNITTIVPFREIFVAKVMNKLIYYFCCSKIFVKLHNSAVIFFVRTKFS